MVPYCCSSCSREETEMLIMRAAAPAFIIDCSDMAKEFIHSCLIRKSHLRPSAWQLQRYSWIKVGLTLDVIAIQMVDRATQPILILWIPLGHAEAIVQFWPIWGCASEQPR
jgi:hypothetical protein